MDNYKFFNENVLVSRNGLVSQLKGKRGNGITAGCLNKKGYLQKGINGRKWLVHDLVWTVFKGEIPEGYIVHHINEDKSDNRLENLELMSMSAHSRMHKTGIPCSEKTRIKLSKKVIQITLDGKPEKLWGSLKEIERKLGFAHTHISDCCRGKYKTAYGYIWRYT